MSFFSNGMISTQCRDKVFVFFHIRKRGSGLLLTLGAAQRGITSRITTFSNNFCVCFFLPLPNLEPEHLLALLSVLPVTSLERLHF